VHPKEGPPLLLTAGKAKAFTKLLKDKGKMAEIREKNDASLFWDHGAKKTREFREITRAEFEYSITANFEISGMENIWSIETITERTKEFLSVCLEVIIERMKGN
jgi:hypothetical protein